MTRLLAVTALALTAFGGVASAEPLGGCGDRKVDVACQTGSCDPERGCQVWICVVWYGRACLV